MPFKQAFGSAALPVAGVSAIAIAVAIGYVIYIAAPSDDAAAPREIETVSTPAPPRVDETTDDALVDMAMPDASAITTEDGNEESNSADSTPNAAVVASKPVEPPVVLQPTQVPVQSAQAPEPETPVDVTPAETPAITAPESEPATVDQGPAGETATAADHTATPKDVAQDPTPKPNDSALDAVVPALSVPTVDIVRIPPEGISTVAGRADADVDILIFIDGVELTRVKTGASGDYVALFDIPAVDHPREMQIAAQDGETRVFASSSIVIAPFKAVLAAEPVVTAQSDDATDANASSVVAEEPETNTPETETPETETANTQSSPQTPPASATVADETPVAPTVMVADETGVKILQSAAPITGVSIDAITYDPEGAVFASGRGMAGATVRLYLNNSALMDTSVGTDGQWRAQMDVAAGIYSLRADMVVEAGKVLSRVEIPFKREDVAVLERLAQGAVPTADPVADQTAPTEATEAATQFETTQSTTAQATALATKAQDAPQPRIASITVQPGNTLWGIASETYGDGLLFARVFNANVAQIRDPDLIYPGQVFVLPDD